MGVVSLSACCMTFQRTIISAMNPSRYVDDYTEIFLIVWFEELDGPISFVASPFDCERHGKELWIRAMAGEFGPIEVLPMPDVIELEKPPRMLTYDR